MNSDRIEGAARDVGGRVIQGLGKTTGDNRMRADGLASEVAGKGQEAYGQAVESVRDVADRVTEYADEAYDRGSRYVQEGARSVEHQLSRHPLAGLVLTGAFGFLLGVAVAASVRR